MTRCGTCGRRVRFIGSHVLAEHVPYLAADVEEKQEALRAERRARAAHTA